MRRLQRAQAEVSSLLAEIQSIFVPGTKVLLVVDGDTLEEGMMMGDADPYAVIDLIRYLDALPGDPPLAPETRDDTRDGGV